MKTAYVYSKNETREASEYFTVSIDTVSWEGYGPDHNIAAMADLSYDNEYLYVTLRSVENESNIICGQHMRNGPVCRDSCMEFFFAPVPGDNRYFNFEMNSMGVLYTGFSPNGKRSGTGPVWDDKDIGIFGISAEITDSYWQISYRIPFSLMKELLPETEVPAKGTVWRANCYKCADDAAKPHYLTWNPVGTPAPDYHVPEFFGEIHFN